jgi:Family of unknown function (DUF5947)
MTQTTATGAASAETIARLRRLGGRRSAAAAAARAERCDLCGTSLPDDHRHMLQTDERRILCVCEPCLAMRAGEPGLRPTGIRTVPLEGFDLDDELWASFAIPIGLAFFLRSSATGAVVALYPSPAGATESELSLSSWEELVVRNPVLRTLETDVEALVVNRLVPPPRHAIVPIDRCYELVGTIKAGWTGITGGTAVEDAVTAFFDRLRPRGAQ